MATPDCIGSSFDDFLKEEGILEQCEATAIKRVIAWQLQNFMETQKMTKTEVARKLGTSRSFVGKILDATNPSITLNTIFKVAHLAGKSVRLEFGDEPVAAAMAADRTFPTTRPRPHAARAAARHAGACRTTCQVTSAPVRRATSAGVDPR